MELAVLRSHFSPLQTSELALSNKIQLILLQYLLILFKTIYHCLGFVLFCILVLEVQTALMSLFVSSAEIIACFTPIYWHC